MEVTLSVFELLGIVFGGGFVLTSFTIGGVALLLRQVSASPEFVNKLAEFAGKNVDPEYAIALVNAGRTIQGVAEIADLTGGLIEDIFDGPNASVAG